LAASETAQVFHCTNARALASAFWNAAPTAAAGGCTGIHSAQSSGTYLFPSRSGGS